MFHAEIPRKPFLEILQAVSAFVAKGDKVEAILTQARINATGDKIVISGTNLEHGIKSTINGVNVLQEGEILLPCVNALKILKESDDEVFTLKEDGNFTSIILDGANFKLNIGEIFKVEEFPPIPEVEGKSFKIKTEKIEEMINATLFCCAREASRYTLNGLLWNISRGCLTLVSTDGKRLANIWELIDFSKDEPDCKPIVPEKFCSLLKSIPNKDEEVLITFSSNHIFLNYGQTTVCAKLLEGRFPKWQDVIPRNNPNLVEVDVKELLSKIKQATLFTNEKSRVVRLKISNNRIEISSQSSGSGEANISCDATYSGDEFEIGINPDYLKESLQLWKEDKATLQLKDEETAILIESKVSTALNLIMPVSLKS